jgi:hypothetical protein
VVRGDAQIPEFPATPNEVPDEAAVDELLDAYERHLALAVGGRSRAAGPDQLHARHAVAALVIATVIVEAFVAERWPLVRDALAHGTDARAVGDALGGLEVSEVAAGLTSWADREHRAGLLSLDDYDAVLALIAGGAQ